MKGLTDKPSGLVGRWNCFIYNLYIHKLKCFSKGSSVVVPPDLSVTARSPWRETDRETRRTGHWEEERQQQKGRPGEESCQKIEKLHKARESKAKPVFPPENKDNNFTGSLLRTFKSLSQSSAKVTCSPCHFQLLPSCHCPEL